MIAPAMQSPTHTIIALALLSRQGKPQRNRAVLIGSLMPDAFIYVGWIWLTVIRGESQARIWNEIYFQNPMQIIASLFNSIPLYAVLAVTGMVFIRRKWAMLLYYFSLAALIHIAFDFPVHSHDAYAYFEPFTHWRFHSPLSYYEVDHYGRWVGLFEACLTSSCIALLWRRFSMRWARILLGFFALLYAVQIVMLLLAPLVMSG